MRGPERGDRLGGKTHRALQRRRYRPSNLGVGVSEQAQRAGAIPVREDAGARGRVGGADGTAVVIVALGRGRDARAAALRRGSERA